MPDDPRPDPLLAGMRASADSELRDDILPFWEHYVFNEKGWMVGTVTDDLHVLDDVPRHSVIVARILWTFAAAARAETDPALKERWLAVGERARRVLVKRCWDIEYGGVYWSLAPNKKPLEDHKQVYAQGFAIYGLAEWHKATGEKESIALAWQIFNLLETHARDLERGGYLEAFARDWGPLKDMTLSEQDMNVPKSMNTNLHVLEAYTCLVRVTNNERAREALADLLAVCLDHIVAYEPWAHSQLFFDIEWNSQTSGMSWGHDIEASWLLWEAAEMVGDPVLSAWTKKATLALADAVLDHGVDPDGSVLYSGTPDEVVEPEKHWWPQAEGVIGWLNAYELSGDARYRDAALAAWAYIEGHVIDHEHGEWFSLLSREGEPMPDHPASRKMGPWKGPYHNARACLEIARRIERAL